MAHLDSLVAVALAAIVLGGCLGADPSPAAATPVRAAGSSTVSGSSAVTPGQYKFDGTFAQVLAPGPYAELPFAKTFLRSQIDGVAIEVGVWRPDVPEGQEVPIVVQASSYYGNWGGPVMEARPHEILALTTNLLPHGYAIGAISVRGTGQSGGCMDLMGKKEVADLDRAITWLAEQPWSDGNVGMIGKSYPGSTPWAVASTGNPHLKTIVPISGWPDNYELMYRNGSAEIRSWVWNPLYYSFFVKDGTPNATPDEILQTARLAAEGQCPDHATGLAAMAYAGTYGERDPLGYWAERNLRPNIAKNYQGSILLVHGLQDWNIDPAIAVPFVNELNHTGTPVHWLLGQWAHVWPDDQYRTPANPNMRWDWAEMLLRWFDYWLKGETTVGLGPPVQVLDSMGRWRVDASYPPRDAQWSRFHLASGQKLAAQPGPGGSQLLTPAPLASPADANLRSVPGHAANFLTEPMEEDLLISGLPRVHVTVTPAGPTGHLAAWLYAVDGDGRETVLGWTMINLLFADGSEKAKPLVPNQAVVAKMEVQPLEAIVPAGQRLMLRIWEYRDDPRNNAVHGRLPPLAPEPVTLNYGGNALSILEIPTISHDPAAYFEPPHP